MSNKESGIFCGLEDIANEYLLDPTWKRKNGKSTSLDHKENCLNLSGDVAPDFFKAEAMVRKMFKKIKSNILDYKGEYTPSSENWDFRDISNLAAVRAGKKNKSKKPEVTLERAIIQAQILLADQAKYEWTYQMPVASSLLGKGMDQSSNIDLVRKTDLAFDLIELKVGSNNPLYATVEILQYGLAYAVSRHIAQRIPYDTDRLEIFRAKQINLQVWALPKPKFYDQRYNLAWLEKELSNALVQFSREFDYYMTFSFQLLDLDWEPTDSPENQLAAINDALDKIQPVIWGGAAKK